MLTRYRVEELQSAVSSLKQKKVKEAFSKTGIHPWNPDAIDKTKLVNSHLKTVICQPLPSCEPSTRPKLVMHSRVLTCDNLYRKLEEKATEGKERA
ncbi:hypothetical protein ACJMK2_028305 [Sinanodonta woodiana]|uniref:Uncharacterized protein n=1 Tax=Sinanodonta woodiana TaxID=1069815 RepID=A0ABD3X6Q3_SINWO